MGDRTTTGSLDRNLDRVPHGLLRAIRPWYRICSIQWLTVGHAPDPPYVQAWDRIRRVKVRGSCLNHIGIVHFWLAMFLFVTTGSFVGEDLDYLTTTTTSGQSRFLTSDFVFLLRRSYPMHGP